MEGFDLPVKVSESAGEQRPWGKVSGPAVGRLL